MSTLPHEDGETLGQNRRHRRLIGSLASAELLEELLDDSTVAPVDVSSCDAEEMSFATKVFNPYKS